MGEIPVKIKILDKEYIIRVSVKDELLVRRAGDMLAHFLHEKRENSHIFDKQTLLSMVAFDCVFEKLLEEEEKTKSVQKIENLNQLLEDITSKDDSEKG
ncbi:MAG: cell division protein ZapA [Bacteroidetes bacterium]|nr:MAG: cell division protein ZapA [Bacteroidota bacterium]